MGPTRAETLERLRTIRTRLASACERSAREAQEVRLVAIGKMVPAQALRWVAKAGVEDVGENYVRDLRDKHDVVAGVRWHFVGTLQPSGAHHVAALADVVQTVVPGRAAERLARRAHERGTRIPSLVEVDFTRRRTGVPPQDVAEACDHLASMAGLELSGLMTVPPQTRTAEQARPYFRRLREIRDQVAERHPDALELSMGMSLDYEVAVEEGATMVRIGTALFGARPLG